MKFEEHASYEDKVRYPDVWVLLLKKASECRLEGKNPEYYRTVQTLMHMLIDKDRILAKCAYEYHQQKGLEKLDLYDKVIEFIIDLLAEKGYLTRMQKLEMGGFRQQETGLEEGGK